MSASTKRGVRLTIVGVLLFMTVVVASFVSTALVSRES